MERSIPNCNKRATGLADLRVRRNRDGLRDALLELLQTHDFADITVRQIVGRARVGYTTFFRHFSSKDALLDAVIMTEIKRLTDRALPIYDSDDGRGACVALCGYVNDHRALWCALLVGGAAPKVREEMLTQARSVTSARAHADALPADLGAALAVAVIVELLSWWLRQPNPWDVERIATVLYERVIAPSMPPPTKTLPII